MLAAAQTRRQPARRSPRRAGELGPVAAQIALAGSIRGALIPAEAARTERHADSVGAAEERTLRKLV